jgi:hypothetical protein
MEGYEMGQQSPNEFDLKVDLAGSVKEPFARVQIWVDGLQVGKGNAINFTALLNASLSSGRHFVFTCQCGVAGCAGIEDGVEVEVDGAWVRWTLRFPQSTDLFDGDIGHWRRAVKPTVWLFEQREMLREVRQELVYADYAHPWKTEYNVHGVHRKHLAGMVERIDRRMARLKKPQWFSMRSDDLVN